VVHGLDEEVGGAQRQPGAPVVDDRGEEDRDRAQGLGMTTSSRIASGRQAPASASPDSPVEALRTW
jgi:hypothetical protein